MKDEDEEEEQERGRVAPNMEAGGAHLHAISDPGKGELAEGENEGKGETVEGEQQLNEEKEEILRLLRGWQDRETSPVVRGAWADDIGEEHERQEELEEESVEKELEAQACRPKRSLRMQVPSSNPTTLLNSRGSLTRYPSLDQWPRRLSSLIPSMRPAFAWVRSNYARMSLGTHQPASPATSSVEITIYYAAHLQPCAESGKRMFGPCCRSWGESEHTHSPDSLFI